jgi:hypothetical protein
VAVCCQSKSSIQYVGIVTFIHQGRRPNSNRRRLRGKASLEDCVLSCRDKRMLIIVCKLRLERQSPLLSVRRLASLGDLELDFSIPKQLQRQRRRDFEFRTLKFELPKVNKKKRRGDYLIHVIRIIRLVWIRMSRSTPTSTSAIQNINGNSNLKDFKNNVSVDNRLRRNLISTRLLLLLLLSVVSFLLLFHNGKLLQTSM